MIRRLSARLFTILAARFLLCLPLAACAAQPANGTAVAGAQPQQTQQTQQAQQAAPVPETRAPQPAPSVQPAAAAQAPAAPSATTAAPAPARQPAAATPSSPAPRSSSSSSSSAPADAAAAAPLSSTPVQETPANQPAPAIGAAAPAAPAVVAPPAAGPVTMPATSSTGSLLQTLFALMLVLAVLGALAWFHKRYGPKAGGGNANLRIVGSLNLGGRERLLVVEVGNQWIVVGASPGRVNALATMPRQEGPEAGASGATLAQHTPSANSFADWLKQTIDKRK